MRSSNPVFSRRGFSRDNGYAGFNAAPQAGGPAAVQTGNPYAGTNPYAQPAQPQQGERDRQSRQRHHHMDALGQCRILPPEQQGMRST